MCGRYTLSSPADLVADLFEIEDSFELSESFNIAPTQEAAVAYIDETGTTPKLAMMRWGLVPFWAKDAGIGHRMINARSETVAEKPAFRASFKKRRCLVIADGFYEWQQTGGPKQPFFFRLKDRAPFGMAGLWDRWEKGEAGPMESFTIITTGPNEVVSQAHHRMPVIIPPDQYGAWLRPAAAQSEDLSTLLVPFPPELMEGYPVSTYVNKPANQGPRCIEPLD